MCSSRSLTKVVLRRTIHGKVILWEGLMCTTQVLPHPRPTDAFFLSYLPNHWVCAGWPRSALSSYRRVHHGPAQNWGSQKPTRSPSPKLLINPSPQCLARLSPWGARSQEGQGLGQDHYGPLQPPKQSLRFQNQPNLGS